MSTQWLSWKWCDCPVCVELRALKPYAEPTGDYRRPYRCRKCGTTYANIRKMLTHCRQTPGHPARRRAAQPARV